MPTLQQELLKRWNPSWESRSDLAALKPLIENVLGWSEAVGKMKADVRNPDLSRTGVAKALRTKLQKHLAPELRNYQRRIGEHAEGLKAQREALLKPQFDKTDLVGELQRAEVRGWLRGMEPTQRLITLLQDKDGALVEAALGAAPTLSGIHQLNDEQRKQVFGRYLEAKHAATVAALDQAEEANELARVSCQVAVAAIESEVELPKHQFNSWFETGVEPAVEAA